MNNRIIGVGISILLVGFCLSNSVNGQEKKLDIPLNTIQVDTISKKPNPNRFLLGVGFQGELNFNGANSYSSGIYVHSRYNLGKNFQFGGTFAAPVKNSAGHSSTTRYLHEEAQVAFFFFDKTYNDIQNTGFGHVIGEHEKNEHGPKRQYNAKVIVPDRVQKGITISAYKSVRSVVRGSGDSLLFQATDIQTGSVNYVDDVYANYTTVGYAFGYTTSSNRKVHYKLHGNIEGEMRSRKAKRNNSSDFAFEVLYAPSIKVESKAWIKDDYGVQHAYTIDNFKKNNLGVRARLEIRSGYESIRLEIGTRPGSDYRFYGDAKSTVLNGAYILFGAGFGIGR